MLKDTLLPVLKGVTSAATAAAEVFNSLPAPIRYIGVAALAATAALGPLMLVLSQVGFAAQGFSMLRGLAGAGAVGASIGGGVSGGGAAASAAGAGFLAGRGGGAAAAITQVGAASAAAAPSILSLGLKLLPIAGIAAAAGYGIVKLAEAIKGDSSKEGLVGAVNSQIDAIIEAKKAEEAAANERVEAIKAGIATTEDAARSIIEYEKSRIEKLSKERDAFDEGMDAYDTYTDKIEESNDRLSAAHSILRELTGANRAGPLDLLTSLGEEFGAGLHAFYETASTAIEVEAEKYKAAKGWWETYLYDEADSFGAEGNATVEFVQTMVAKINEGLIREAEAYKPPAGWWQSLLFDEADTFGAEGMRDPDLVRKLAGQNYTAPKIIVELGPQAGWWKNLVPEDEADHFGLEGMATVESVEAYFQLEKQCNSSGRGVSCCC